MSSTKKHQIKIDVNSVLDRYEKALKTCPKCGKKMTPLDYVDYCYDCKIEIEKVFI
jgi:uncharacterized OB-fold protein